MVLCIFLAVLSHICTKSACKIFNLIREPNGRAGISLRCVWWWLSASAFWTYVPWFDCSRDHDDTAFYRTSLPVRLIPSLLLHRFKFCMLVLLHDILHHYVVLPEHGAYCFMMGDVCRLKRSSRSTYTRTSQGLSVPHLCSVEFKGQSKY